MVVSPTVLVIHSLSCTLNCVCFRKYTQVYGLHYFPVVVGLQF